MQLGCNYHILLKVYIGIKYLTIEWSENPPEGLNVKTKDIVSKIISFKDDSLINGEGFLAFLLMERIVYV